MDLIAKTSTQHVKLNRKNISPRMIAILDKFKNDKIAYGTLKDGYLKLATHKVLQDSLKHDSFCDYFKAPRKLPNPLLKLYGISQRELEEEMKQFHLKDYKVYNDPYYMTLLLAYLIGLDNDDAELRQYSLALISILIWNYYKLTYFPKVCNADIARYVLQYEMKNNHSFKAHISPLNYIMKTTIPQLEAKYPQEISRDPLNEYSGLKRVITTIRSRYNQLMKGISKIYYKAYDEGKRESTTDMYKNAYADSKDFVEKNEHFASNVDRIADKIIKIASLKRNVIQSSPIKEMLNQKFFISNQVLKKIDHYLEDVDNHEDLKYFIELLLSALKITRDDQLCQFNVDVLSNKITGSKKDPTFIKLKELAYGISDTIYNVDSKSTQTEYRQRKITLTALIAYIKVLHCKKL